MDQNKITLKSIKLDKNKVTYNYEALGEWRDYFKLENDFFIEYDEDISNVPYSILVIPFLCNFLPIAWVFDGEINVEECDKDFYLSIPEFKKGYIEMYPMIKFLGNLNVKNIKENKNAEKRGSAMFFSGGVDSYSTLIEHFNEKPILITLWGSDIRLTDIRGWNLVTTEIKGVSKQFDTECRFVKSSFRTVIREGRLSEYVSNSNDGWWHGFQHGISIIAHAAPIMYTKKLKKLYIASSYNKNDKNVTCASYPTIDNKIRFSGVDVIHDQFEDSRQDKIKRITEFSREKNEKIELRVCWESLGGKNCCSCEKCYRTIMAIEAEGDDPNKYGFTWNDDKKVEFKKFFLERIDSNEIQPVLWRVIVDRIKEKNAFNTQEEEWKWFIDLGMKYMK